MDGLSSRLLEGHTCLKYLSLLAKEYKVYSKFYVEVSNAASSFDDLRRCKARLQSEPKGRNIQVEYSEAIKNFNRGFGGIKFLKHLNATAKDIICKNCNGPTEKMVFMSYKAFSRGVI